MLTPPSTHTRNSGNSPTEAWGTNPQQSPCADVDAGTCAASAQHPRISGCHRVKQQKQQQRRQQQQQQQQKQQKQEQKQQQQQEQEQLVAANSVDRTAGHSPGRSESPLRVSR